MTDRIDTLIAKDEIKDVLHRYALAADRGDLERLALCYHPDAVDERAYNSGTSVASFLDTLQEKLRSVQFVQHDISNILIRVEGDYAESECFVTTRTLLNGGKGTITYQSGARYLDKFERREAVWRIAHRRVVSTWAQTQAGGVNEVLERETPPSMVSRVGPEDPAYTFFRLFRRGEH